MKYLTAIGLLAGALLSGCSSRPGAQGGDFQELAAQAESPRISRPADFGWPSGSAGPEHEAPTRGWGPAAEGPDDTGPEIFFQRKRYETIHL